MLICDEVISVKFVKPILSSYPYISIFILEYLVDKATRQIIVCCCIEFASL